MNDLELKMTEQHLRNMNNQIYSLELKVLQLNKSIEENEITISNMSAMELWQVAIEIDDITKKKLFSNEQSRKAELRKRLSKSVSYNNERSNLSKKKDEIDNFRLKISFLKRELNINLALLGKE